ncbi:14786_t:CDS:1 [Dentiscutata heterogama]|uniref:14786_t:CDS:1 n=1 Tax=Dentiscutata heterogama TaxID=1316150 RepID=A0ACA9MLB4_9GLOM|nr:14786_t:CDS:1 [Dentiscutata heterogama]
MDENKEQIIDPQPLPLPSSPLTTKVHLLTPESSQDSLFDQLNQEQTCLQEPVKNLIVEDFNSNELDHNADNQEFQMTSFIDGLDIEQTYRYNEYFGLTFPPYTPYYLTTNSQITTEPCGLDIFLENPNVEWDFGENEFLSF